MKANFITGVFLALTTRLVAADDLTCTTHYDSISVSEVPTNTASTTTTYTLTSYHYNEIENGTYTSTVPFTYVTIEANTTITVPTGSSFTPLIHTSTNDPTGTVREQEARRTNIASTKAISTLRKSAKATSAIEHTATPGKKRLVSTTDTTSYPTSVDCTSTASVGVETTTHITDYTTYTYFSTAETHKTTHVATATAYAACGPDNLVSEFDQSPIDAIGYLAGQNLCDPDYGTLAQEACASPLQCCEAIQAQGYSGFAWTENATGHYPYSGIACFGMVLWSFGTGDARQSPWYVGNGPSGSGSYGVY